MTQTIVIPIPLFPLIRLHLVFFSPEKSFIRKELCQPFLKARDRFSPFLLFFRLKLPNITRPKSTPDMVKVTTLRMPDAFKSCPWARKPIVSKRITRTIAVNRPCSKGLSLFFFAEAAPAATAQRKLMPELTYPITSEPVSVRLKMKEENVQVREEKERLLKAQIRSQHLIPCGGEAFNYFLRLYLAASSASSFAVVWMAHFLV